MENETKNQFAGDTMDRKEVADYLGVSAATVWRWYKQGLLPSASPPNPLLKRQHQHLRFHRADVDRLRDTLTSS